MAHTLCCFPLLNPQDTQLLLWDLEMDEIVVPLRRAPGGSPTYSTGSQSAHWDNVIPMGTLQPAPCKRDVPKLSPVIAHRVHTEPLSGLMFTQESVVTACREGHIKIWTRPSPSDTQSNSSEANPTSALLSTSFPKDNKTSLSSKISGSNFKQWPRRCSLKIRCYYLVMFSPSKVKKETLKKTLWIKISTGFFVLYFQKKDKKSEI